jgi:hypothetical protein
MMFAPDRKVPYRVRSAFSTCFFTHSGPQDNCVFMIVTLSYLGNTDSLTLNF